MLAATISRLARPSSATVRSGRLLASCTTPRTTALGRPCTRNFSVSRTRWNTSQPTAKTPETPAPSAFATSSEIKLDVLEPRLSLTFTCTAGECNERSTHTFTKRAYERGIVLVGCPGCKNRHLIADHIGWFKESTEEGKLKTVEDLLRARGEKVRRGRLDAGGVVEYVE
ncbi:zf-DNL-domain-containing protein [Pleurotus eryngii]|uniref:Zf-DNL-domain-containing protein n=1 Tax=Pleurotus eryngii TaxID=5323 RepID=A0A9P6A5J6_PLEER|nr:zf-DNL-domain-containing protein [Pleurotus eryngii]